MLVISPLRGILIVRNMQNALKFIGERLGVNHANK